MSLLAQQTSQLLEAIDCPRCASGNGHRVARDRDCCAVCACAFARGAGMGYRCGCGQTHRTATNEIVHWRGEHWWIGCAYQVATGRGRVLSLVPANH